MTSPRTELDDSLGQAFQHIPVAMVVVDADGRITRLNRLAETTFGYGPEELLGHPVEQLLPERYRGAHPGHRRGFLAEQCSARPMGLGRDLRARRKDGSEFPVEIGLNPVQTSAGPLVLTAILDLSEREQARVALQRVNEALEERVNERTAELRQHVRELEAFSHTAAHDLRSPVRAISGLGEILNETHGATLGDEGREMLQRMTQAARRMGELIDALLRLSRLSNAPLHRGAVDLGGLARDTERTLRFIEPQREVVLDVGEGLQVDADPALMRSVVGNLVRNAWKFSRDSRPARIRVARDIREGRPVYFVRDNGCGFDMAQADRLFNAFFRLHSEQDYGGSGLGLSIAQRIVQRHGGVIWAEGEPGRGATVYFTLGD